MRPAHEVADVFAKYGDAYKSRNVVTPDQRKVMAAIQACRTSQLGGHEEVCLECGTVLYRYNSCRNRHCPKCQTMAKEEWLAKRRQELLPCGYFHLVFTVPHILNPFILANRRELLSDLFTAVNRTIAAFARDPQWRLRGKAGMVTILHTWSQTLIDHFHIHCLIPAGVLSFDNRRWIKSRKKYLFSEKSLAKEFKRQYLTMLTDRQAAAAGTETSDNLIQQGWTKQWVVYAKKPFTNPRQLLEYLGRYTHRIAISNHRIRSIDNGRVVFTYKDRAHNNTQKEMNLDAFEFIRRFLLHVLPKRFMKIRYYGFLANNCRQKSILLIRRLIGVDVPVEVFRRETIREKMLRLTGRDILRCPCCKTGILRAVRIIPALNSS